MPDRIIRAGLLTSEAWLSLKNNDDRVCWIVLFLNADTLGNQPAGPYRVIHLCRHAGIDTPEKVAKMLCELADVDLVRPYTHNDKPYIHIPRYRQSRRFLGKLFPLPPWATDQDKQSYAKKSQETHRESPETSGEPPIGVGVGVGVGVNSKTPAREIATAVDNLAARLTAPTSTTGGLIKNEDPKAKSVNTNPSWKVPSLDDHAGLDRMARDMNVQVNAFPDYPSLQQHLIALVRTANAEERRHAREKPLKDLEAERSRQLAYVAAKAGGAA